MDIITDDYHPEWQMNRIKYILKNYPDTFWKDKKVLELGSFNGVIGNHFRRLGANVLSIEGRMDNVNNIKKSFPELNIIQSDLDTKGWHFGKFDVIINFGLIYHLENYHNENIINCINNCEILFLETVVYDSDESTKFRNNEGGIDQSLSDVAYIPTRKYIEEIFEKLNISYTIHNNPEINGGGHYYDWIENNSGTSTGCNRRFWIIKK
jgi:hypothetical protein